MTKSKKTITPKNDTAPKLVSFTLPTTTRETPQNLIVPEGALTKKELWFIKKNLTSFSKNEDGTFSITLPERGLKERGL